MFSTNKKRAIVAVILVVFSLFSFFVLSEKMTDPETYSTTLSVLDEQQKTVEKVAAASIIAASAIDLIPGDAGGSVADALVELGGYFVIIFAAIYLEKMLLMMGGALVFKVLIPLGCLMIVIYLYTHADFLKNISFKLISLGLVLILLVPTSVWISQAVEKTLGNENVITEIEEQSDSINKKDESSTSKDESAGVWDSFKRMVSNGKDAVKSALSGGVEKGEELFNNFVKSVAIFIVTTCVIPVLTFLLLYLFIRHLLGYSVNMGSVKELADKRKVMTQQMKGKLLRGSHGEEAAADLADVVEESADEK